MLVSLLKIQYTLILNIKSEYVLTISFYLLVLLNTIIEEMLPAFLVLQGAP